jgi:HprK-related kinase A
MAVMLPAPSGSGKSTLCAALAFRGWRLLSDELAVVQPDTGELIPLPRPISLKNHSIEVIRAYAPEAAFGAAVCDTNKGTVCHVRPPVDALTKAHQRARPRWFVFPKYSAGAPAVLKPLSRAATFMALLGQTFNYHIHGRQGFAILAALNEGCEGFEFTYSELDDAVRVFDQLARRAGAPA